MGLTFLFQGDDWTGSNNYSVLSWVDTLFDHAAKNESFYTKLHWNSCRRLCLDGIWWIKHAKNDNKITFTVLKEWFWHIGGLPEAWFSLLTQHPIQRQMAHWSQLGVTWSAHLLNESLLYDKNKSIWWSSDRFYSCKKALYKRSLLRNCIYQFITFT